MRNRILREVFVGFVRTRRMVRHFSRLALLETLGRTGVSRELPAA